MPIEMVLKACVQLQTQGKAQVFYSDDTDAHGVKFFNIWEQVEKQTFTFVK